MKSHRVELKIACTWLVLGVVAACRRDWTFLQSPGSAGSAGHAGSSETLGASGATAESGAGGVRSTAGAAGSEPVESWPDFPANARRIAIGERHVCMIRESDRAVYCIGDNERGQRGDGKPGTLSGAQLLAWSKPLEADRKRPFLGASWLAAGNKHTCAVRREEVWCWGDNDERQIGRDAAFAETALQVLLLRDASPTITAGPYATCARESNNSWWCWGHASFGEISDPKDVPTRADGGLVPIVAGEPVRMTFWPEMGELVFGNEFASSTVVPSRSTQQTGVIHCWGRDDYGQCGNFAKKQVCPDASERCVLPPQPVPGIPESRIVDAGAMHACAVTMDEQIVCWGQNDVGQSEPGVVCSAARCVQPFECCVAPVHVPVVKSATTPVTRLALGRSHSCALIGGMVQCWGDRAAIGAEVSQPNARGPVSVLQADGAPLQNVIDIDARGKLTCALTSDDALYCWGFLFDTLLERATRIPM